MLDYFTNSMIASVCWGCLAIGEAYMGKKNKELAMFIKFFVLGIAAIVFYLIFNKKITKDTSQIWKKNKLILAAFVATVVVGSILANYFYFTAIERSGNRAYLVIAITWTLPIVFATIALNLFFNEAINIPSMIGIALIISGVFILKIYNQK